MRTLSVALVLVAGIFTLTRVLPAQVTRELRLPLKGGKLSLLALGRALLDEYTWRGHHRDH